MSSVLITGSWRMLGKTYNEWMRDFRTVIWCITWYLFSNEICQITCFARACECKTLIWQISFCFVMTIATSTNHTVPLHLYFPTSSSLHYSAWDASLQEGILCFFVHLETHRVHLKDNLYFSNYIWAVRIYWNMWKISCWYC